LLLGHRTLTGCSSSDDTTPAPADTGTVITDTGSSPVDTGSPATDTGTAADTTSADTTATDGAGETSTDAATDSGKVTLTVENYLAWCTVSVNGASTSTASVQTIDVTPGTVVNLVGDKANATFVWGYWYGTAGDTTAAHDTAKTTTVTVNANMKIQACCPFATSPTTPCPPPT
jgi:hypothetical protein